MLVRGNQKPVRARRRVLVQGNPARHCVLVRGNQKPVRARRRVLVHGNPDRR